MLKDELAFLGALAVAVGGSTCDPAQEYGSGRTQQDDCVELRVDRPWFETVPETYRQGPPQSREAG